MCMESETGRGDTVRATARRCSLAWGSGGVVRNEVGVDDGSERGMEIVGSPLGGYD